MVIVKRKGKPYAVLISSEQCEHFKKERESAWASVRKIQEASADKNPDKIYRDVTAITEKVRQERHEKGYSTGRRRD